MPKMQKLMKYYVISAWMKHAYWLQIIIIY